MRKIAIITVILLLACSLMAFAGGGNQRNDGRVQLTFSFWGVAAKKQQPKKLWMYSTIHRTESV